ncbi:MAG: ABC transporter permease, partial [Gemmatimonadales bacterium]
MAFFSLSDIRHAWRGIVRSPAVSFCAVACLALGLGATTAVSSAIDRAMLQPPPFKDPAGLVQVYRTAPQSNDWPMSAANFEDLARGATQLSSMIAIAYNSPLVSLPGQALQVTGLRVTGEFFPMLGVSAEHGRLLTPTDDDPSQPAVAVMSDEFWRRRFGADPGVVGRALRIDGREVTIVGIAPRGLRIPRDGQVLESSLWLPMRFTPQELANRGSNWLMIMGRLAPHATAASATAQLNQLHAGLAARFSYMQGEGVHVVSMQAEAVQAVAQPLFLMFGAVFVVLLISATDVASLFLARGVRRDRETAVRLALGAGRWAVMRPMLLESLLLAAIGVTAGIGLAWVGVRTIGTLASQSLPQLVGLGIDFRVVGFALLIAAIVAAACGAWPAWRSSATDPQDALRGGRGGGMSRGHHRALSVLVVTEVALSMVLLVGAGLVLKGFARLAGSDPGFDAAPVLTFNVTVSPQAYPDNSSVHRFLTPAVAAIAAVPQVAAVGTIQALPYRN